MPKRAVVLLSGGVDSTTTLAIAKSQGFDCYALSFSYGQRHNIELVAARRVADAIGGVEHKIVDRYDVEAQHAAPLPSAEIPVTYVPARNTIFLSFALAWAEVLGAQDIFLGVNALDYSGYPDCRPEYIAAFQQMADLATKAGVEGARLRIHTPLIQLTKAQIIRKGRELGVDFELTLSCYDPSPAGEPCGHCDACLLRAKGFAEAAAYHSPLPVAQ